MVGLGDNYRFRHGDIELYAIGYLHNYMLRLGPRQCVYSVPSLST